MKVENVRVLELTNIKQVPSPTREGPVNVNVAQVKGGRQVAPEAKSPSIRQEMQAEPSGQDESRKRDINPDHLAKVVQEANKTLEQFKNKQLSFFVDKKSGKQGVRIIDAETKKVIKQIPPEEMLELAARIKEQVGAIIDETI